MASSAAAIDIYNTPAAPAPPGEVNNLINPDTQQTGLVVTFVLAMSTTATGVLMRLFTKAYLMRSLRSEDCASAVGIP